jgi:hypothetical protein
MELIELLVIGLLSYLALALSSRGMVRGRPRR